MDAETEILTAMANVKNCYLCGEPHIGCGVMFPEEIKRKRAGEPTGGDTRIFIYGVCETHFGEAFKREIEDKFFAENGVIN